jgi:hypothetical protein
MRFCYSTGQITLQNIALFNEMKMITRALLAIPGSDWPISGKLRLLVQLTIMLLNCVNEFHSGLWKHTQLLPIL